MVQDLEAVVDVVDIVVPPVHRRVSGIEVIKDGSGRVVPGRFCNASHQRAPAVKHDALREPP
jgi:hypothetical protein